MTSAPAQAPLLDELTTRSRPFEVVVARAGERTVASVRGEVDVATAPILRAALTEACALDDRDGVSGPLTVDLASMTFIDASGLNVLVGASHRARRQGREFVLRHPRSATLRVLEITRLLDAFTIERPPTIGTSWRNLRPLSSEADRRATTTPPSGQRKAG